MGTTVLLPQTRTRRARLGVAGIRAVWTVLCALVALALLGYHPWAEDGGIYASALALRLNPELFPAYRGFAVAHTGHSLFAPVLAILVRASGLSLPRAMFLCHAVSIVAMLLAAGALAKQIFADEHERRWSVLVFAVSLGVPVAGTSLYLADPYLTARSLSTPLLLWATALLLQRRSLPAWLCVAAAGLVHPMMTAWGAVLLLMLTAWRSSRRALWTAALATAVVAAMAVVARMGPADTAAVRAASLSRSYWFPMQWAWYEWVGAAAPVVFLAALCWAGRVRVTRKARELAGSAAIAAAVISAASLLLVHIGSHTMLLARVQPMRLLHPVYLLFVLLLGGLAARTPVRPLLPLLAAAGLFAMQRDLYRDSLHLEAPWRESRNGYERAFVWAREHTLPDALFALDADYTTAEGADAQVFRAVAQRSALPDAAKDGGIASVTPALAEEWAIAARAQAGLSQKPDWKRLEDLRPFHPTWIVLPASSATAFACPYRNDVAKVCRLPL